MKNNFLTNYFKGAWNELKKVSWPTRNDVLNHTIIVIISVLIATAIVAALDYGLSYLVQYIVERN